MMMKTKAFTLIEMLVVIAIIGILAALLSGPLMGAKQEAQVTACLNNLKQIGTAMTIYRDADTDDAYSLAGGAAVDTKVKAGQYLTGICVADRVPTKIFLCPVLGSLPGTGDTLNMALGNVGDNADTAYLWTIEPMTPATAHPARVVCADIAGGDNYTINHGDAVVTDKNGGNILKADGSADTFKGNAAVPADTNDGAQIWKAIPLDADADVKKGSIGDYN